jgi:hypothetical protein
MEDFSDELQKLSDEQLIGLLARQFTAAGFGPEKLRLPLSDEVREEIYEILYTAKVCLDELERRGIDPEHEMKRRGIKPTQ